ncbi:MAG: hypothetical protein ACXVJB_01255 [Mucilaginibacter sp.]
MKKNLDLKRIIIALPVVIIALTISSCGPQKTLTSQGVTFADNTQPLQPILNQVKDQYDKAAARLDKSVVLTEVDAIFDVANSKAYEGSISVWVVKGDYKRTTAGETTITYSLLEPKKEQLESHLAPLPDSDKLAKLIVNTANDFVKTQSLKIANLELQTFEIDINYAIDSDGTIDISPKIGNVGLDGSYERDHKVTQTIKLMFKLNPKA